MVKKFLLIFAILFAPCMVHADNDGLVITSSETLTSEILPLDVNLMKNLYFHTIYEDSDCGGDKNILEYFLDGNIKVPFSAKQLLKVCRKNTTYVTKAYLRGYCKDHCTNFVFKYMQAVTQKAQQSAMTPEKDNTSQ